jgi:hypothetical protein
MRLYVLPVGLGLSEAHGRSLSESDAVLAKDNLAKEGFLVEREPGRKQIRIQVPGAGRPRVLALDKAQVEEVVGEEIWDESDPAEGEP